MLQTVYKTPSGLRFLFASSDNKKKEVIILQKGTDTIIAKADFSQVPYGGNLQEAFVPYTDLRDFMESRKLKIENLCDSIEYLYRSGRQVIVDPYAMLVSGRTPYGDMKDRSPMQIRAGFCVQGYDWGNDTDALRLPYESVVAYYLHVRGFTQDPSSRVRHRGTFLGLKEKIPYLLDLGINQVILMPAYEYEEIMDPMAAAGSLARMQEETAAGTPADETDAPALVQEYPSPYGKKLNYWGYTKSWYFAPKAGYSFSSRPDVEFKDLVRAMHQAGIELVMEFAFPDEVPADLALDALLWWVQEYHVDGFRLLARNEICKLAASCQQLAGTKLLGAWFEEPGRSRSHGYRNLADCNDGFRTDCRRLLKGDDGMLPSFIARNRQDRQMVACVNYITDHDGFTLCDLVSYDRKHNEENGEQGMDGAASDFSWNCGIEGPTRKPSVMAIRARQMKNALAMLLLARGTPMLLAGDEFGNSQGGNNNPWCIDSEVTWLNWSSKKKDRELHDYVRELIAFRKAHPVLTASDDADGKFRNEKGYPAFSCHSGKAWYASGEYQDRHVGMMYCDRKDGKDSYLYAAYNFNWEEESFALPYLPSDMQWKTVLTTDPADPAAKEAGGCPKEAAQERSMVLPGRCVAILEGIKI